MAKKAQESSVAWFIKLVIGTAVTVLIGYAINQYISTDKEPEGGSQEINSNQVRAGQGKG